MEGGWNYRSSSSVRWNGEKLALGVGTEKGNSRLSDEFWLLGKTLG